jgi:thiamine-phosphate pyrophosphorylase
MTEDAEYGSEMYLVVEAGPAAADRLAAILQAVDVASVLIRPPSGQQLDARVAKPLVDLIQARDVAALIADDASLARALRADGVHLDPSDDIIARYEEARDILGKRYIVGVHAGKSRHTAMELGEAEADYIAFGVPGFIKDREAARKRRDELVGWWCEIFEVPCVAMDVTSAEEAKELVELRADFIAVEVPSSDSVGDSLEHVRTVADAIKTARSCGEHPA